MKARRTSTRVNDSPCWARRCRRDAASPKRRVCVFSNAKLNGRSWDSSPGCRRRDDGGRWVSLRWCFYSTSQSSACGFTTSLPTREGDCAPDFGRIRGEDDEGLSNGWSLGPRVCRDQEAFSE